MLMSSVRESPPVMMVPLYGTAMADAALEVVDLSRNLSLSLTLSHPLLHAINAYSIEGRARRRDGGEGRKERNERRKRRRRRRSVRGVEYKRERRVNPSELRNGLSLGW
jgi:hypothetical protein